MYTIIETLLACTEFKFRFEGFPQIKLLSFLHLTLEFTLIGIDNKKGLDCPPRDESDDMI